MPHPYAVASLTVMGLGAAARRTWQLSWSDGIAFSEERTLPGHMCSSVPAVAAAITEPHSDLMHGPFAIPAVTCRLRGRGDQHDGRYPGGRPQPSGRGGAHHQPASLRQGICPRALPPARRLAREWLFSHRRKVRWCDWFLIGWRGFSGCRTDQ